MGRVRNVGANIVVDNGGTRIWSSDGRPVNLLPASAWLTPSLSIVFPDFEKRNAYMYHLSPNSSCISLSSILPGEWGPDGSGVYLLADAIIGTVPTDVNYLDVRLLLARTKTPTDYLFRPVANQVPTEQTLAPGGSCLCESTGLWSRAFEIVLIGTNVVLRRRQSVVATQPTLSWNSGNNNSTSTGGRRNGWTHGGGTDSEKAYPAAVLQISPANEVFQQDKRRGEGYACSLTDTTDFSSIWTGSAVIRPGYLAP